MCPKEWEPKKRGSPRKECAAINNAHADSEKNLQSSSQIHRDGSTDVQTASRFLSEREGGGTLPVWRSPVPIFLPLGFQAQLRVYGV